MPRASARRRSTTSPGRATGNRTPTASSRRWAIPSTSRTATYTNSIGDAQLSAAWTDPDFDPSLRAVYYARVLEIPTPRWTAYDAVRFKVEMPDEVRMITQERAYTSPIWYTP